MEFPDLGKHCQEVSCKRLDFLPFKCDSCKNVFCQDHFGYSNHNCKNIISKDFQVPLCPLCNQAVPYKRGEIPDISMSAHIDRDCKSDPAEERRRKIFKNKCFLKGCKQQEIIPFECSNCKKNFCLRHRHESDHKCAALDHKGQSSKDSDINIRRLEFYKAKDNNTNKASEIKKKTDTLKMNDDEALQYAISLSLQELEKEKKQNLTDDQYKNETEDEILARVLAQSEQEHKSKDEKNKSCLIN